MAQSLRQEYAARAQNSDIFGSEQPDTQKVGRRVVQGQEDNDIFSENVAVGSAGGRSKPERAPFLTEENAVNTHGRRGGYVENDDSLLETEPAVNGNKVHYETESAAHEQEDNSDKYNENSSTAKTHKARNMTSHIFDDASPADSDKRSYNRDHMSNVF